jgi:imidazolonepropionase-like amidohydrolase
VSGASFVLREVRVVGEPGGPTDRFVVDGLWSEKPSPNSSPTLMTGGFLVPPLVDSHAHLTVEPEAGNDMWFQAARLTESEQRERTIANLMRNVMTGVLAIRDAGAPSGVVARLAASGEQDAWPYLRAAGRIIAGPGRQPNGIAHEVLGGDLTVAADSEAANRGGWIKLIADAPHRDQAGSAPATDWSIEEVQSAVAAAARHGARVIFHALTREASEIGLAASVHSIEHGWGLAKDDLASMGRQGIAWTPTARGLLDAVAHARDGGARAADFLEEGEERLRTLIPIARRQGVRVLTGTDVSMKHGAVVRELLALVELGMEPADAVFAATRDAWEFLGLPKFGIEGKPADFLIVSGDPLQRPELLSEPTLVVRAGSVVIDRRGHHLSPRS